MFRIRVTTILLSILLCVLLAAPTQAQQINPDLFPSQVTTLTRTTEPTFQPTEDQWQSVYPIAELTPKRKIGGLIRFNDPSFFYAEQGKLVTNHGRYKRHRTFLFPHLRMDQYPYGLRVRMKKRDNFPVQAGFLFGAKTPFEFERGSANSHGALFAYVGSHRLEFRDHRTYEAKIWNGVSNDLSDEWRMGDEIVLEVILSDDGPYGTVFAEVSGAVHGVATPELLDLGKPDEITNKPHIRGKGYFGFAVDGEGEVEILEVSAVLGPNTPQTEGFDAYTRACEWAVMKENARDYVNLTFALREATLTSISYRQNSRWSAPRAMPETAHEREGGHTMFTHKIQWTGARPDQYRLMQDNAVIYEGRIPPFVEEWADGRTIVGLAVGGNEVWRYKQQNQLNWFDHILTQDVWQGDTPETFGPYSTNMGDNGSDFMKYQGVDHSWPDFLFGGDDYPGYPDNPILTMAEVDYQQRIWDALAMSEPLRDFHGSVPSAFKGGDHEFSNADQLQPGGFRGERYPAYIKNAYKAVSLEGFTPVHPDEMSYISKPVPGWIEVFHMVTRYNQTISVNSTEFPEGVDKSPAQSPSGLYVMEQLEEWARTSPAPFKIVHQDHPLGDIRDVSPKECYRMYPWERGAMIRLVAETGLIYAMGDEHNLRLVKYTDFSNCAPADPRLAPLKNMSIWELGISNLSGEWFRHVREGEPSIDGFEYDVLYQSVPATGRIAYEGFQPQTGYTVFRFDKQQRNFQFEIWQRNNVDKQWKPKDPRSESPNFSYTIDPKEIFWDTSQLPTVDLKQHGIAADAAAGMAYTVKGRDGEAMYSNRADAHGVISGMACPPLAPGVKVTIETENGVRINVTTE
jgi:hypothetical protein